jgi:hypothetical protein
VPRLDFFTSEKKIKANIRYWEAKVLLSHTGAPILKGRPVLGVSGMTVRECPTQEETLRYLRSHDRDRRRGGDPGFLAGSTIPGPLRAPIANPGIPYFSERN